MVYVYLTMRECECCDARLESEANVSGTTTRTPARHRLKSNPQSPSSPSALLSATGSTSPTSRRPKHRQSKHKRHSARTVLFWLLHRHWIIPLLLILAFLALYALNPTASNPIHPLLFLSYRTDHTPPHTAPQYGKGPLDLAFILFHTLLLTFTRSITMQEPKVRPV